MEIVDIPDQISKSLKYSTRSWRSFLLSLSASILILAIAFDLLYGFLYIRIHNVKDPRYGQPFWVGLILVALVVPFLFAAWRLIQSAYQMRKFKANRFGIAIAPFEVISLDPDTLSTASKLQALDQLMQQFFSASQRLLKEENWTTEFDFRVLPPHARILGDHEAVRRRTEMDATLLIWGTVVQQSKSLKTSLHLLGTELDLTLTGALDPFFPAYSLKLWSLFAAAMALKAKRQYQQAREFLALARGPAQQLDQLAQNQEGGGLSAIIDSQIRDVEKEQNLAASESVRQA